MPDPGQTRRLEIAERSAKAAGALILALGVAVLSGWMFDWTIPKSVLPGWPKMAASAAFTFMLAGASLLCTSTAKTTPPAGSVTAQGNLPYRVISRGLAIIVALLGCLKLCEYLLGADLGIDRILFNELAGTSGRAAMSLATAFGFVLTGCALHLAGMPGMKIFQFNTMLIVLIGWLGFSRYLFGGQPLLPYASMAGHTALGFVVLGTGILCLRVDAGLMALLASDSAGGSLARRLVPAAVIVPVIFGYLRLQGQRAGWYGTEAGVALLALSNTVVFGGLIWRNAALLDRADLERKEVEQTLRESETRFRTMADSAPVLIWISGTDKLCTWFNRQWLEFVGRPIERELGNGWAENVHPDDLDHCVLTYNTRFDSRQPFSMEYRIRRHDGQWRWLLDMGVPRFGSNQEFAGYIGSCIDITDHKRLEEQLRHSQKMEAVGRLTGGVAHDFNNLLTVILGYSDLLRGRLKASDFDSRPLLQIQRAAEQAALLTGQLLSFSRRQPLQLRSLDLNEAVGEMATMMKRLVGEDIDLRVITDPVPCLLKADAVQITQVVMNLVVNARDAMPKGGKLVIETKAIVRDKEDYGRHGVRPAGRYAMLAVSDSGSGMSAETQAHMFEPFFTTKAAGKGTGLGLATVYGIVQQHNGWIDVYSEPGFGTSFKIYLPRTQDEPVEAASVKHEKSVLQPATILIVEDQAPVRLLMEDILTESGHRVLSASKGSEALALAENYKYKIELLITDVVMPGMNGPELVSRLTPLCADMVVLYISGYTDHALLHNGVIEEGTALLQKPFLPEALVARIDDLLRARRG